MRSCSLDTQRENTSNERHVITKGQVSIKSEKSWIGESVFLYALLDDDASKLTTS